MNHPFLTRTLMAAGALLMGTSASAIDIDTFLDDPSQIVASQSASGVPSQLVINTPHALGGQRELIANSGVGDFGTLGIVGDGLLQYANTPDSAGSLELEYQTGGADLTDGGSSTGFLFTIAFADAPVDYEIEVRDGISSVSSFFGTFPTGITGNGDEQVVYIPFSSFVGGGADLTDVNEVIIFLTPNNDLLGADLSISSFSTGVPEPSSLALLALGGLAMMRRRRSA
ncbi:MAG: PEP-CTERM sorting domain-containing protein [Phycisphaeraceae bacterium]